MINTKKLIFFLGGHDLEMLTIRQILEEYSPGQFWDKGLYWGAKTSDYREEIRAVLKKGMMPVLIELTLDMEIDKGQTIIIDHHGKRAGSDKPTSLHQVFELLSLPHDKWTRWFDLVAANDRGYIPAMLEINATQEEIRKIRASDRAAQGINEEQEKQAEEAILKAEIYAEGKLTVVRLPYSKTSTVADRLQIELGGNGYQNLFVISPDEVNFFGDGSLVYALNKKFSGGWYGGALPEKGFWGYHGTLSNAIEFLTKEAGNIHAIC